VKKSYVACISKMASLKQLRLNKRRQSLQKLKSQNKGFNTIRKKTIQTLEDRLFFDVKKKIKNCSPETRENYLEILKFNEKLVALDEKFTSLKRTNNKFKRVIKKHGKKFGGGFKKRTKKLDDILSPWANCDNKGIIGENDKYNEEIAPKIAKMRLARKTKKRR